MEPAAYRAEAEAFLSALIGEQRRHFAGLQEAYEIAPIYERHAGLFTREAIEGLRGMVRDRADDGARALLEFAVEGHIGAATRAAEAEIARREATLRLEVDGERLAFREASSAQANEPDGERRARIEAAWLDVADAELNPLRRETLEQAHDLARDLGWPTYRAMCEELSGIDLRPLAAQTAAFSAASAESYATLLGSALERELGFGLAELRRSDLPRFFRATAADAAFGAERLVPAFAETLAGLGIDLAALPNVRLDVERRALKSPRPFCAPVSVPGEVHLVVPPIGGREDFYGLFHEGGHALHYAHADAGLPVEWRCLGDNSVTEGYAFLLEGLVEDPGWLRARLGVAEPEALAEHARAVRLLFLRRFAAKLDYELELHGEAPLDHGRLAAGYARRLGAALAIDWPEVPYLLDVDPGFYCVRYLRAWALEAHLRAVLQARFGLEWFASSDAGALLRELWAQGQRRNADELLAELTGERLDFGAAL